MDGTFLLTIEGIFQAGDDLLVFPLIPADKYNLVGFFDSAKLVSPDGQVVEMKVEVSRPFLRPPADVYSILILNAKEEDAPVGSQIWIKQK